MANQPSGRLTLDTDANGNETAHTYDEEDQLQTTTDSRGMETDYTFDHVGRISQIDYPGGWSESYTYWEPGMLKTKTNAQGMTSSVIDYDYDDLYQLSEKTFPSGTPTQYTTDAAGLRSNMQDASGEKRYYYDDDGRLTKIEQGPTGFVVGTNQNYVLEWSWTDADQKHVVTLTIRTKSAVTWTHAYTNDGQLYTVTNPDSEVTLHEYLDDGRPKKLTIRYGSVNYETREFFYQDTNSSHSYVADKNRRLRRTKDTKISGGFSSSICLFDYEIDPAGRYLSETNASNNYRAFQLDPLGQIKTETKWSAKTPGTRTYQYGYTLDPNGNRLQEFSGGALTAYTYGDNNEMLTAGSDSFTYDEYGNTASWDHSGTTYTFTWDFESHMIGASGNGTDTHEYDGDGRRMRSKLNGASDWTNFIYDETVSDYPALICEYTLISGTFTVTSLNTWSLGLISTNRGGTRRYNHFDGIGNTVALTDSSGNTQDTYTYSAFGVLESSSGSSVNPFRWRGELGFYDDASRGSGYGLSLPDEGMYLPTYSKRMEQNWPAASSALIAGGGGPSRDECPPAGSEDQYGYCGKIQEKCSGCEDRGDVMLMCCCPRANHGHPECCRVHAELFICHVAGKEKECFTKKGCTWRPALCKKADPLPITLNPPTSNDC